jgi:branched-chain amino acid transport system permease protein
MDEADRLAKADRLARPDLGAAPLKRLGAGAMGRWRVPMTIALLAILPLALPSKALAVNVLVQGLYAAGFNLLFGYTGLLSFGHAAFFGASAYATGIAMGTFGLNWLAAILVGVVIAGALAAVIGVLAIRTRGIYFAMVTLALAQLVYYVALQASDWTGGENGFRGFTLSVIALPGARLDFLNPLVKYYVLLVFVGLALWLLSRILASPFGAAIEAIRENETRARACGFGVERLKLMSFVLSGLFCGLAGSLYALHLSIVPLGVLGIDTSGLAVMMVLLGGAGTFLGPFVGAFVFLVLEDVLTLWTPHWQLFLGAVFMLCVLYLPKGIWGTLSQGRTTR